MSEYAEGIVKELQAINKYAKLSSDRSKYGKHKLLPYSFEEAEQDASKYRVELTKVLRTSEDADRILIDWLEQSEEFMDATTDSEWLDAAQELAANM